MSRAKLILRRRGILAGLLVMGAAACIPIAPPGPAPARPRPTEGSAPPTAPRPEPAAGSTAGPVGTLEKTSLKIGLPPHATTFLPIYLAAERTAREEGLSVELVTFQGGAGAAQALASDSVDVNVSGLNTPINMMTAGQQVKGFYAGFSQAGFEWFARPEIKSWAELRGKSLAVAAYGDTTDFLTRHMLRKHGLDPERDVQIVQAGGSATRLQAIQAGTADAAILATPFKWQAEAEHFTRLGTQAEVAEQWPVGIFSSKERFLEEHPNAVRALLRAHVKAIRMARMDREAAIQTIVRMLKYERQYAERSYDESITGFDERGALPAKGMPVFWEIAVAAGEVTEPWPEARFLDRRFIDTFDAWAPK